MANLRSASDLKKAILENAGEVNDGSSDYEELAMSFLNDAYKKVCSGGSAYGIEVGEPWAWAKAQNPTVLILKAPYETGTVQLTGGSSAGVFNSAPSAGLGSFAGRLLRVKDRPEFFRILTHVAGAGAFVLDSEYTDTTGAALEFKAFKLDYDIGSATHQVLRLVEPFTCYRDQTGADTDGKIYGTDPLKLRERFPLKYLRSGVPTMFAKVSEADGIFRVRFNKYVTQDTRVEVELIPSPADLIDSDDSIPIVPLDHRCVLEYLASYRLCLGKEDTKSADFLQLGVAQLKAMQGAKRKEDHQVSSVRGQLIARPDLVRDPGSRGGYR